MDRYSHESPSETGGAARVGPRAVWRKFPKFLVGFLVVVVLANAGLLSPAHVAAVSRATTWLFALAFAGVGFSIRLEEMRTVGLTPVLVLFVYLLVVGPLTLFAVSVLL